MRITKVKVGTQVVTMSRNTDEGFLLWGNAEKKQGEIEQFLKAQKQDSFHLSIRNKTLEKERPKR